jgi:hypothetical protein
MNPHPYPKLEPNPHSEPRNSLSLSSSIDWTDGFVAYVNGVEGRRTNMGATVHHSSLLSEIFSRSLLQTSSSLPGF